MTSVLPKTCTGRAVPFSFIRRAGYKLCQGFCCLLFAGVFKPAMFAQAPDLSFDTQVIGNAGQVSFTPFLGGIDVNPEASTFWDKTTDHSYVIFFNPNKISWARSNVFSFQFGLKRDRPGDTSWYVYNVKAQCSGKFPDENKEIRYHIKIGKEEESSGKLNLPIHNYYYDSDLSRNPDSSPTLLVTVSDPQGPKLSLRNTLESLGHSRHRHNRRSRMRALLGRQRVQAR